MAQKPTTWTTEEPIDLENVSTEPPPPIDDGYYRARFTAASPQATNAGKPAIRLELQVTSRHGDAPDSINRRMYDNVTLTQAAAFRLKQLVVASGVTAPSSTRVDVVEEFCNELVGIEVWLRSKQEKAYNDPTKMVAKVDRYLSDAQLDEALADPGAAADAPRASRGKRSAA